jgi:hypothetical protein
MLKGTERPNVPCVESSELKMLRGRVRIHVMLLGGDWDGPDRSIIEASYIRGDWVYRWSYACEVRYLLT